MTEDRVISILAEFGSSSLAIIEEELKRECIEWKRVSGPADTILYDEIWEHPNVTKANGPRNPANYFRYTLYRLGKEDQDLDLPRYKFVAGTVGNPCVFVFNL